MTSIRLSRLSFSYRDAVEILSGVSLHLDTGWTGIVGANGGGKSTLLRLVAGELAPAHGTVRRDPDSATCHLCPQRVDAPDGSVRDLAGSWTKSALRWQSRLGLNPDDLARWPTLSPGERKRWQIGAALAARPDILLLDEPTNHVDAGTRALLIDALQRFRGLGLVVSHDRDLLQALTTATVRVRGGNAVLYRGSYAQARAQWEAEAQQQREAHAMANKRLRTIERRLHERRQDQAAADASISARTRIKGPRDSDARSMLAKGRAEDAAATLARAVAVTRGAAERAAEELGRHRIDKEHGRSLFIDYEPPRKRRLLSLDCERVRAGDRTILYDVHAAVQRDSRIHLRGANGTGKTTLVNAMLASSPLPAERLLYLPQIMSEQRVHALWQETRALERRARGRVLQAAAALGLDPERTLASDAPSPGEARKLLLAWGLGLHAWLLVLDEPTNHLDLPSLERMQKALEDYPGALLLVTHDDVFASALAHTVWTIEQHRLHMTSGPDDCSHQHAPMPLG